MQKEMTERTVTAEAADEELIDTLIAISVVAKRLARKLSKPETKEGGNTDGENE